MPNSSGLEQLSDDKVFLRRMRLLTDPSPFPSSFARHQYLILGVTWSSMVLLQTEAYGMSDVLAGECIYLTHDDPTHINHRTR